MKHSPYIKYFFLVFIMHQNFNLDAQNLHVVDSLQNLLITSSNDTVKANALIDLSQQFAEHNSDKAFDYAKQGMALSMTIDNKRSMGKAHNNLGDLYWYRGDYGSSSAHYFKALKVYEVLKDKPAIADCYRNIGWIYYYQKNYNEALNYYDQSLTINKELNRKRYMGSNYNDIAIIYSGQKKYKEAIDFYKNSLKISREEVDNRNVARDYMNLSYVYNNMGKLSLAIECIQKSVKIGEEIGNKRLLSGAYCNLGEYYIKAKKFHEAAKVLQKSMDYSSELNDKNGIIGSFENFSALYEAQNDFRKAFEYKQLSSALQDSLYNESNSKQANEMTAKYESEKKELLIKNLEKDKALSDEKLQREKNFRIYLIIFLIMTAFFVFVLLKSNALKKKANAALSGAYEEIEEKNKDITDSINYSKRIQDASLSPKELKYKLFPEAFVLFKPKDIVSGDFYWFTEKNGKRLIASCDCTGHGVPGALMSMIGNNILNQIVNEKGITSPDEVLNHLNNELRKAMKQEGQSKTQDGMDIALVTFNSETEIEYAGAQRPLWIVKSAAGAPFLEIKADKFSIGGNQSEGERKFTKHNISLSKGDCIYIFSDGLVDQFGGAEGKKFMSKKFKDLLLANYTKPMLRQEDVIVETVELWKGIREQVDDILVIGIKV